MTRKEIARRAVDMTGPERVPIRHNRNPEVSDVVTWTYRPAASFVPVLDNQSEWGFVWERLDGTMGQPKYAPVDTWDMFRRYKQPEAHDPSRFSGFKAFRDEYADRYILGTMGITGFNLVTFIRGFDAVLEDIYLDRDRLFRLVDMVFGFEEGIIEEYGKLGLDGVSFYDDWGTQRNLMIDPEIWRKLFRPRYEKQFDLAHRNGLHVYFHSCGYCYDILGDLIEIGADILNLNQPNIYGIESLGEEFGGRVCFHCPVDIQTTAIQGGKEAVYRETRRLIEALGKFDGGFIGQIEDYYSMGFITEETYRECFNALIELGAY
jgi:uroporphyrinogen decarboxylase